MPFNLGPGELLLLAALALIIFGPKKLPELGKTLGKTVGSFKKAVNDLTEETTAPSAQNPAGSQEEPAQSGSAKPTVPVSEDGSGQSSPEA